MNLVVSMKEKVEGLRTIMAQMPQYEPVTKHYFHAGMYCREVWRDADVTIVGRVHKKEHFYVIAGGTIRVTTDDGVQEITGPHVLMSKPGTQRAVYSVTPATCMTFHITDAKTPEEAEVEMVEAELVPLFNAQNKLLGDQS